MVDGQAVERTLMAVTVLTPLIRDIAQYIAGGKKPRSISRLPKELQSEIELRRLENRV